MIDYKLEHILSFAGKGGIAPEAIGPLAEGLRVNYNTGGEISGPHIRGKLRPVGGDWDTVGRRRRPPMLRTLLVLVLLLPWSHARAEEIPLERCDTLLLVQVRISGMKFLFLVDTAAVSMLNLQSFAHGEPFRAAVKSWNGTTETRAQEVLVGDFAVGQHHFKSLRLTAVDLSAIGRSCGRRIDGILGIDLLAQLGATVDIKNHIAHFDPDAQTAQARIAELDRQFAACEQAFNRADEPAFADCLDPQVVLFAVGGDYYGRDAAMDYYRSRYFRQNPPAQCFVTPRAHHLIGDAIWMEYDLRVTVNGRVILARGTALYQKEDGKWRAVHMNQSTPPSEATQPAAALQEHH